MASQLATVRKDLSAPGLIRVVREQFFKVANPWHQVSIRDTLADTLCAALAMFQFKWPSLLQFDEASHADETIIGKERKRHEVVVAAIQGNRNVFVDDPSLAESVYQYNCDTIQQR